MLQSEYIRSMQSNYERILLDKQPEEKRYQYCILSRGGIKGLLPCSLRYLNGLAYLYYDITSRQSVAQLYGKRCITREWLKDFMWSYRQIQMELARFLLDERNILWYPEQIFQDLENHIFSFLYIPYYEGESSFLKFLEYLVEHIDYGDETLVECVYKMYEQYERGGDAYLQGKIFEDAEVLNSKSVVCAEKEAETEVTNMSDVEREAETDEILDHPVKKGIRYLLDGRKRKSAVEKARYRQNMQLAMEGYVVAEEASYEKAEEAEDEELGKTVYIEERNVAKDVVHRLYTPEGKILIQLNQEICTIGKKRGEADLVLEDFSVSRLHARIVKEQEEMFLEDMNSTNGTYKNGLRMQPYEKRKLHEGDEIKMGKVVLIYR